MRSLAVIVAAAVLSIAATAAAQPGLTPPQYPDGEEPASQPPRPPVYEAPSYQMLPAPELPPTKSEGTATMLSLGATAAGFAMIAAGADNEHGGGTVTLGLLTLIIGPSAGHIYAGESSHAVGMSLLRGGAFLTFAIGMIKTFSAAEADCFESCTGSSSQDDQRSGERMMWVGGITFVAATVYDIMDASRAAHRTNEKSRRFSMMPTMVAAPSGPVPAFSVAGRF